MKTHESALVAVARAEMHEAMSSQALQVARAEAEAARVRREEAGAALHAARTHADSFLPTATVVISNRSGTSRHEVVIVERTKKTIKTRHPGTKPGSEQQWRESKYRAGVWNRYPAEKDRWSSTTTELELPDPAAAPT